MGLGRRIAIIIFLLLLLIIHYTYGSQSVRQTAEHIRGLQCRYYFHFTEVVTEV